MPVSGSKAWKRRGSRLRIGTAWDGVRCLTTPIKLTGSLVRFGFGRLRLWRTLLLLPSAPTRMEPVADVPSENFTVTPPPPPPPPLPPSPPSSFDGNVKTSNPTTSFPHFTSTPLARISLNFNRFNLNLLFVGGIRYFGSAVLAFKNKKFPLSTSTGVDVSTRAEGNSAVNSSPIVLSSLSRHQWRVKAQPWFLSSGWCSRSKISKGI